MSTTKDILNEVAARLSLTQRENRAAQTLSVVDAIGMALSAYRLGYSDSLKDFVKVAGDAIDANDKRTDNSSEGER